MTYTKKLRSGEELMRVFIGSSKEAKHLVEFITTFIRREYQGKIEPVPWTIYWSGGPTTIEHLERFAEETDASILFFTADDRTWYREVERHEPRDNLVFEAGLFFASHNRFRTQIVVPSYLDTEAQRKVAIPSDLAGLTLNYFDWSPGDLEATGLPYVARKVCEALLAQGIRPRLPSRLNFLASRPDMTEIKTFVGDFRSVLNDGVIRLAQEPATKEIDVLVAYRMGDIARTIRANCNRPGVKIRICFSDMWDEELLAVYLRKYKDRDGPYIQNAICESITKFMGSCDFVLDENKRLREVRPKQNPEANFEISLTSQRITYSFYRVDDTGFVIPLDMKEAQDPPPLAWVVSQETASVAFNQYSREYLTMFSEGRLVYSGRN
jgi:hypothetical protein